MPDAEWTCSVCTFQNPSSETSCEMCGQMMPIDIDTAKEAFPNLFVAFKDLPEQSVVDQLVAAKLKESKASAALKKREKEAKALGSTLLNAVNNENSLAPIRDVAVKREMETFEQREEQQEQLRLQRLTEGERSIELAKTEAAYVGVERKVLQQPRWLGEHRAVPVDEEHAVRKTDREAHEGEEGEGEGEGAEPRDDGDVAMEEAGGGDGGGEEAAEGAAGAPDPGQRVLPMRRLRDFVLHDAAGQLCRLEVLDRTKARAIYASGYVCPDADGVDEQEDACAGVGDGLYVARLGPFFHYEVKGYSSLDAALFGASASLFLSTNRAEYELAEPAKEYAPLFIPMLEKVAISRCRARSPLISPLFIPVGEQFELCKLALTLTLILTRTSSSS